MSMNRIRSRAHHFCSEVMHQRPDESMNVTRLSASVPSNGCSADRVRPSVAAAADSSGAGVPAAEDGERWGSEPRRLGRSSRILRSCGRIRDTVWIDAWLTKAFPQMLYSRSGHLPKPPDTI